MDLAAYEGDHERRGSPPGRELVVVITSANFARRDAHALSDRLLVEQILVSCS